MTAEQQAEVPEAVWEQLATPPVVLLVGGEAGRVANLGEATLVAQPFFATMTAAHLSLDDSMFLAIVPGSVTQEQLDLILPGAIPLSLIGRAARIHTFQAGTELPVTGYVVEPVTSEQPALPAVHHAVLAAFAGLAAVTLRYWRATGAHLLDDRRALLLAIPIVILPSADEALTEWRAVQRSQVVVAVAL